MKATIDRSELAAALAVACKVAPKSSVRSVLSDVALVERGGAVAMTATDAEQELTITMPKSPADKGFAVVLPADRLKRAEGSAPPSQSVEIVVEDASTVAVSFGKIVATMAAPPRGDFPVFPQEEPWLVSFTIPRAEIAAMLGKVFFATSTESSRYYLKGICMTLVDTGDDMPAILQFAATDGHRISTHDCAIPSDWRDGAGETGFQCAIIPSGTCLILENLCKAKNLIGEDFTVEASANLVRFTLGDAVLVAWAIDGQFPDYSRVIPWQNDTSLVVNKAEFSDALGAVSCFLGSQERRVSLSFSKDQGTVSVSSPATGTAKQNYACAWSGEDGFTVRFNSTYLNDVIKRVEGDALNLMFRDSTGPVLIPHATGVMVLIPLQR